jgi:signal transduction histidine kinase
MARIIHDVMDVCRDSRGKLRLNLQRVDLAEIVEDAITTARPSLVPRGHRLSVTLPSGPVFLNADPSRFQQVLTNLLTNAAKFTDAGGTIWLTVDATLDAVVIRVRDNGRGISPEMLPVIFNPFQQGNDPAARGCGLGLGLSLVKSLVELHGGTIAAHSDGPGTGAEFTIRLPVEGARLQVGSC